MPNAQLMLEELGEHMIAQRIGIPHDEARMRFRLQSNTVHNFNEFADLLGTYLTHHYSSCVVRGGTMSRIEAIGRAEELLEQDYRRRGGDLMTAFNDAQQGLNSGARGVLDRLCEALKAESVERYVRHVFQRHVDPASWEDKVELLRQFIAHCRQELGSAINPAQPERYAANYRELIRAYVDGVRRTSASFRRY